MLHIIFLEHYKSRVHNSGWLLPVFSLLFPILIYSWWHWKDNQEFHCCVSLGKITYFFSLSKTVSSFCSLHKLEISIHTQLFCPWKKKKKRARLVRLKVSQHSHVSLSSCSWIRWRSYYFIPSCFYCPKNKHLISSSFPA